MEDSNRVTLFLFENLPSELWPMTVPGTSRRTVRMIAGHLHNARCMWIKMLGRGHGIRAPKSVSRHTVTRRELLPALRRSSDGIVELLELGINQGGRIPASGVAWLNLPVDVVHVLSYLVAHEGHHRGQIVPAGATGGPSAAHRDHGRAVALVEAGKRGTGPSWLTHSQRVATRPRRRNASTACKVSAGHISTGGV